MSILSLWQQNKDTFSDKSIEQVLIFCGKLSNNNETSMELREFFDNIPTLMLKKYSIECLLYPFKDSGFVLQDIVNQIGKRIGFIVEYGLYRGVKGQNGFDGLWEAMDGHKIVIEVKTTDTYRINLDDIAKYRKILIDESRINQDKSSILIIVGRDDTGDLEAQIRGSKHAWDIRVISIESLLKLMFLKEKLNDRNTFNQINELLKPLEYTRVDNLIEIAFNTSEDLQSEDDYTEQEEKEEQEGIIKDETEKSSLPAARYHELCISRISKFLSISLVKQAKTLFMSADNQYRLTCIVSKTYFTNKAHLRYWYAFHPSQVDFLEGTELSFVALGCGSENNIVLIPYSIFASYLSGFRKTEQEKRTYWHVEIFQKDQKFYMFLSKEKKQIEITNYLVK